VLSFGFLLASWRPFERYALSRFTVTYSTIPQSFLKRWRQWLARPKLRSVNFAATIPCVIETTGNADTILPPSARVECYCSVLNNADFPKFTQPVKHYQVAAALEYLDQNYGAWEEDEFSAWEYVLPALLHLYPESRRFGFWSALGPVRKYTLSLIAALLAAGVFLCLIDMR
jgi:hypothetical protein